MISFDFISLLQLQSYLQKIDTKQRYNWTLHEVTSLFSVKLIYKAFTLISQILITYSAHSEKSVIILTDKSVTACAPAFL